MTDRKRFRYRQLSKRVLSRGVFIATAMFSVSAITQLAVAQGYRYNPEHRRPLEATIHHLEAISERNTYSGRERERYDNAIRHVSQFAERLHEGRFDKDKLDEAI